MLTTKALERFYIHTTDTQFLKPFVLPVVVDNTKEFTELNSYTSDLNYLIVTQNSDGSLMIVTTDTSITGYYHNRIPALISTKYIVPTIPIDGRETRTKVEFLVKTAGLSDIDWSLGFASYHENLMTGYGRFFNICFYSFATLGIHLLCDDSYDCNRIKFGLNNATEIYDSGQLLAYDSNTMNVFTFYIYTSKANGIESFRLVFYINGALILSTPVIKDENLTFTNGIVPFIGLTTSFQSPESQIGPLTIYGFNMGR